VRGTSQRMEEWERSEGGPTSLNTYQAPGVKRAHFTCDVDGSTSVL